MGVPPHEFGAAGLGRGRADPPRSDPAHPSLMNRFGTPLISPSIGWGAARYTHDRERRLRPRAPLPISSPRALGPGHRVVWWLGATCERGGGHRGSLTGVGVDP